jgi:hypothetical protein
VKLTHLTCAPRNSLTNFEYHEAQAITGNGSYVSQLKLAYNKAYYTLKKLVKTLWLTLFSASFSQLESPCDAARVHQPSVEYLALTYDKKHCVHQSPNKHQSFVHIIIA